VDARTRQNLTSRQAAITPARSIADRLFKQAVAAAPTSSEALLAARRYLSVLHVAA